MRIAFLARKPIQEANVALNTLAHHTGGLNIEVSRMPTNDVLAQPITTRQSWLAGDTRQGKALEMFDPSKWLAGGRGEPSGRYPTNVIFMHHPDCVCSGETTVGTGTVKTVRNGSSQMMDASKGWNTNSLSNNIKNAPSNRGAETIGVWQCNPACPVHSLQPQSAHRFYKNLKGEVS